MRVTTYKKRSYEAIGVPIPVRYLHLCKVSHCNNTGAYSVLVTVAAIDYLIDISQHDLQIMADVKANKPSA